MHPQRCTVNTECVLGNSLVRPIAVCSWPTRADVERRIAVFSGGLESLRRVTRIRECRLRAEAEKTTKSEGVDAALTQFRGHLKIGETMMPKQRKTYPDEFKKKLIALVRGGRTPEELSRQFERVLRVALARAVCASQRRCGTQRPDRSHS
jgi:hypothetical protein